MERYFESCKKTSGAVRLSAQPLDPRSAQVTNQITAGGAPERVGELTRKAGKGGQAKMFPARLSCSDLQYLQHHLSSHTADE